MKELGIIGGLGPLATADFYRMIVKETPASFDQEHINVWIRSLASTPKRVEFIRGESTEDPSGALCKTARELADLGADILVMPCITAHYFYERIQASVSVPLLNAVDITASYLRERQFKRAGFLGTEAIIESGYLEDRFSAQGIKLLTPAAKEQALVKRIIFEEIKKDRPPDISALEEVIGALIMQGAEAVLLGCSELSTIENVGELSDSFLIVDMMRLLAKEAVRLCRSS